MDVRERRRYLPCDDVHWLADMNRLPNPPNPGRIDVNTRFSCYPKDLAAVLRDRWNRFGLDVAELPTELSLQTILDICYQASLLREEDDPVKCRVMIASQRECQVEHSQGVDGLHVVAFESLCDFSPQQIRKISPAINYYRSIICVDPVPQDDGRTVIWGMAVTGTGWIHLNETTVHEMTNLPYKLMVHILGPGHLVFSVGLQRIMETIAGEVLIDGFDPFRSKWLPQQFASFRNNLLERLDAPPQLSTSVKLCDSFVRDVAQSIVRRTLSLVRSRGHGGMLIYLYDRNDPRLDNWLRVRMRFSPESDVMRFERLITRLMRRTLEVGMANGIEMVRWRDFLQMRDFELGALHESLVEFSHFLADLMSVDGSLVLDREFRLIGFGGEILGDSHVSVIDRAIDLEAEQTASERADASGTRHRSAYRLVSSVQETIVVVVSQDGAVRFVAHRGGKLVYWPYLP